MLDEFELPATEVRVNVRTVTAVAFNPSRTKDLEFPIPARMRQTARYEDGRYYFPDGYAVDCCPGCTSWPERATQVTYREFGVPAGEEPPENTHVFLTCWDH